MNEYNFNVKFEKGRISSNLKKLVQNDYNSTKINFTFDKEGRKLFKMLYPDGTAYITQIDNDELIFGPGILNQDGIYEVEIALYTEDGRLTDYATTKFDVRAELIQSDEIVEVDDRLPILDSLISDVQGAKTEIEDAIQYATEQGDYAKEQANRNFDAIEEATKIVDNFEENVNEYKENFDNNADLKTNDFNNNAAAKTTVFNQNVTDKIEDFNENAAEKVSAYNSNADEKLNTYNSNATEKLVEYNNNADNLISNVKETRNELERIKNDVLETGEASGNYLTLNDSTMAEYQELEVEGVCEQVVTTGKNKIGFQDRNVTSNGITASFKNEIITLEGHNETGYAIDLFNSIPVDLSTDKDETYVLSYNVVFGVKNVKLGISFRDANNAQLDYIQDNVNDSLATKKTLSAATLNNTSYLRFYVRTQELLNGLKIKIQLEKGDVPTEYEPFTGGKASPNPDYPQEISVIENELKVVSCNKNLYNKDTDINDYVYSSSGDFLSSTYWNTSEWIKINSNLDYYLSCKTTNTINILVSEFDKNKNFIQRVQFFSNTTFKYIPSERTKYIRISYKYDIGMYDLQLEENTQATPFEEHLETVINANLGNEFIGKIKDTAKDTLRVSYNEEDGEYHLYLDKNIGKFVLDGSENWIKSGGSDEKKLVCQFETKSFDNYKSDSAKVISSHFIWKNAFDINVIRFYNAGNNLGIAVDISIYPTLDDFKILLSTLKPEVYYILKTPYTVDLGVIDMPISYDGVTNLFTDSDLIPIINAKYYRNFTETVRNLQINNDTLKNELAIIENRLSALEAAQVSVVNESEVIE